MMSENEKNNKQTSESASDKSTRSAGDPGRTPSKAEGDEETVDQDIEQKLGEEGTRQTT